jgi:hypothetical protein
LQILIILNWQSKNFAFGVEIHYRGIIYDSNGKITSKGSLTYEFDSHSNWLSYTSDDLNSSERKNAGEPFAGELRTITYY